MLIKEYIDITNNPDFQENKTNGLVFYNANGVVLPLFINNKNSDNLIEEAPHVNHYKIGD